MTNRLASATPAAAVAQNGTITFSYPTGTTAGDFASYGHKMFSRGLQKMFSQDEGTLSVSFGASDITLTYKGATSIPADTFVRAEFNIAGKADVPKDIVNPKRISFEPVVRLDLGAPDTADANGYVESQDLTTAGAFSVDTTVAAALAAAAQFDGTATAKDMFLNTAYATTTDVDADATQTISGTIVITWINLGDY